LSREEAAQQRGKKLLQAVAGIRPGSEATASWGVIRHQKVRVFAGLYSMKEMMAPERCRGEDDCHQHQTALRCTSAPIWHPSEREGPAAPCPRGNREPRSKATEGTLSEMRTESKTPIFCGQAEFVSASRDPQDVRRRML
jgi:hypothetical protein